MQTQKSTLPDQLSRWLFGACALITILVLVGIFGFLFVNGIGFFQSVSLQDFLTGTLWRPEAFGDPSWGIASLLLGTLYVSAVAMCVAVPIGMGIAIYLSEVASPRMREIMKPIIESIGSIPSVTLGLIGILFLAPIIAQVFSLPNGLTALTAGVLVGVAALPTIASVCDDALMAVNHRYREPGLALGASRWQVLYSAILPAGFSGVIAGIMLGFGRIIGETMVVLMVAGNVLTMPESVLDSVRPLPANIAIEVKEVVVGELHWQGLFAMGLVLFLITFCINLIADRIAERRP